MTPEQLGQKHDGLNGSPDIKTRGEASKAHTHLSVQYAISILEQVANPDYQIISDGQCGIISIPQYTIYEKITELKKLLP